MLKKILFYLSFLNKVKCSLRYDQYIYVSAFNIVIYATTKKVNFSSW